MEPTHPPFPACVISACNAAPATVEHVPGQDEAWLQAIASVETERKASPRVFAAVPAADVSSLCHFLMTEMRRHCQPGLPRCYGRAVCYGRLIAAVCRDDFQDVRMWPIPRTPVDLLYAAPLFYVLTRRSRDHSARNLHVAARMHIQAMMDIVSLEEACAPSMGVFFVCCCVSVCSSVSPTYVLLKALAFQVRHLGMTGSQEAVNDGRICIHLMNLLLQRIEVADVRAASLLISTVLCTWDVRDARAVRAATSTAALPAAPPACCSPLDQEWFAGIVCVSVADLRAVVQCHRAVTAVELARVAAFIVNAVEFALVDPSTDPRTYAVYCSALLYVCAQAKSTKFCHAVTQWLSERARALPCIAAVLHRLWLPVNRIVAFKYVAAAFRPSTFYVCLLAVRIMEAAPWDGDHEACGEAYVAWGQAIARLYELQAAGAGSTVGGIAQAWAMCINRCAVPLACYDRLKSVVESLMQTKAYYWALYVMVRTPRVMWMSDFSMVVLVDMCFSSWSSCSAADCTVAVFVSCLCAQLLCGTPAWTDAHTDALLIRCEDALKKWTVPTTYAELVLADTVVACIETLQRTVCNRLGAVCVRALIQERVVPPSDHEAGADRPAVSSSSRMDAYLASPSVKLLLHGDAAPTAISVRELIVRVCRTTLMLDCSEDNAYRFLQYICAQPASIAVNMIDTVVWCILYVTRMVPTVLHASPLYELCVCTIGSCVAKLQSSPRSHECIESLACSPCTPQHANSVVWLSYVAIHSVLQLLFADIAMHRCDSYGAELSLASDAQEPRASDVLLGRLIGLSLDPEHDGSRSLEPAVTPLTQLPPKRIRVDEAGGGAPAHRLCPSDDAPTSPTDTRGFISVVLKANHEESAFDIYCRRLLACVAVLNISQCRAFDAAARREALWNVPELASACFALTATVSNERLHCSVHRIRTAVHLRCLAWVNRHMIPDGMKCTSALRTLVISALTGETDIVLVAVLLHAAFDTGMPLSSVSSFADTVRAAASVTTYSTHVFLGRLLELPHEHEPCV